MEIALLVILAAILAAAAIYIASSFRETPEQRERKRRVLLHTTGRVGDAMITEVEENTVFYAYSVSGVQYETSQDVSAFRDKLPSNLERLIGPASLKYSVRNPANSIVICEQWSGLRAAAQPVSSGLSDINGVGHQTEDAALAEGPDRQIA